MRLSHATAGVILAISPSSPVLAQSEFESLLCEAAETGAVVEIVYDEDASKGCLPRLLDVHQVAIGNNGLLYLHGWQTRGCTKGRDYESERIFRFDKIQSVEVIEGEFGERSQSVKDEGWDGCIGTNCFIEENICE
ncbi:WYL domain-containing protein [Cognatiyoonia koreensis]|uniref:WYL domain-containing protein n=2 Tax=Cognatiyoonia koreensis TaxID=364200 RepID=A0A1I0MJP1_9RHOB|nr:WYL domain-containing protein [Cognatiyoonia koreensis]